MLTSNTSQLKAISIDSNQYTLPINSSHEIVLNGTYTDNETIDIAADAEYTSSNHFGIITGLKAGQAIITATYENYTTTWSVSVISGNAVTGVALNKQTTSINVGNIEKLVATVSPGIVTITATTVDGSKAASCSFTINNPVEGL